MNTRFQKLISRVPDINDDDIQLIIEQPPQELAKKDKLLFRNRPQQIPSKEYKVYAHTQTQIQSQSSSSRKKQSQKSLQQLLQLAKRRQKQQVDRDQKKPEKKEKIKKDKLKNLERYKQLNQENKPKQNLEQQQRLRKYLLWQKKSKQAAQMLDKTPSTRPPIVFSRTEVTEQVCNEYIQHQQTNFSSFLKMILEQDLSEELIQPQKKKVPQRFSGKQEYLRIFQFLIVNQTIASLHNSYRSYKNSQDCQNPIKVNMAFYQTNSDGFQVIQMEQVSEELGVIPHTLKNHTLSKHNLVLISSSRTPNFQNLSVQNFKDEFLFLGCLVTPQKKQDLSSGVRVLTMINRRNYIQARGESNIKAYVFYFEKISTFIREFLGIRNVQFDDLSQFIYNPSLMNRVKNYVNQPAIFKDFFEQLEEKYNTTQLNSIKQLCLRDRGIIMLQGPPGTGKTSTLLGVLSGQYHYIRSRNQLGIKKILVCTPSNTAVDHIIKRIVTQGLIGPNNKKIRPKVLRTGVVETKDEDVRSVYLDDLSQKQVLGKTIQDKDQKKMTIFEINQKIKHMQKQIRKMQFQYKYNKDEEQYKIMRNKISQKQKLEYKAYELRQQRIDEKSRMNEVQKRLITQAEIILTTLSSTGTERFQSLKGKFSCLIVDEAGQCTEPNLMIALGLNVPKILLIGDPCQLPATTFSPDSNVTLYNRSLFQRMIDGGLKPYFLDIQYRMCPKIRQFPSEMFYQNRLKDAPTIAKRQYPSSLCRGFKHKNVWFINVKNGKQQFKDKSYMNQVQAQVVKTICQRKQLQGLSIGIITPYNNQKHHLKRELKKDIFVNTIDSFQGQQKDVIIISCVRSSPDNNSKISVGFLVDERRINVALTRGRFLLIVVGNAYTLGSNQVWHKFLNFTAEMKSYITIDDQQKGKQIISRMAKNKLTSDDTQCNYQWKKHKVLSKDVRKAERESITLQDFQDGEIVEQEYLPPIEQQIEQNQKQKEVQRLKQKQQIDSQQQKQVQEDTNKKGWDVKQAMQSTGQKLKAKYGSISFFDLMKKM